MSSYNPVLLIQYSVILSHSLITAEDNDRCVALVSGGILLMIYQSNSVIICNSVITISCIS